jgi:hypothetical protein
MHADTIRALIELAEVLKQHPEDERKLAIYGGLLPQYLSDAIEDFVPSDEQSVA